MFLRLWWKESRIVGPLWLVLLILSAPAQWLALVSGRGQVFGTDVIAWSFAVFYSFAIGASTFAAEREFRTFTFLDSLGVDRKILWLNKSSFAVLSTLALAVLVLFERIVVAWAISAESDLTNDMFLGFGSLLFAAIAWSVFWSALTGTALLAAVLAMGSLLIVETFDPSRSFRNGLVPVLAPNALLRVTIAWATLAISCALIAFRPGSMSRFLGRAGVFRQRRSPAAEAQIQAVRNERAWAKTRRFRFELKSPFAEAQRLAWQTFEESRLLWIFLGLVSFLAPLGPPLPNSSVSINRIILIGTISAAAGVSVFGRSTHVRANRFFVHHGVRPALVWTTAEFVWAIPLLAITAGLAVGLPRPRSRLDSESLGFTILVLINAFVLGQMSGMVFSRAITAWTVSLAATLIATLSELMLVYWNLLDPRWLVVPPIIVLAATAGLIEDWQFQRSFPARWRRLAIRFIVPAPFLIAAYIAERAWGIPDVGPPFGSSIQAGDESGRPPINAADYYSQAARLMTSGDLRKVERYTEWKRLSGRPDTLLNTQGSPKSSAPDQPTDLGFPRHATDLPFARFGSQDMPRPALHDRGISWLAVLLAYSAAEKQAAGNLKDACDDVLAIFRMANQFAATSLLENHAPLAERVDAIALEAGMCWAVAPAQTPASLRAALSHIAHLQSPVDTINLSYSSLEYSVQSNDSRLTEELARTLPAPRFFASLMTSPWERVRAERVLRASFANARSRLLESPEPLNNLASLINSRTPSRRFVSGPRVDYKTDSYRSPLGKLMTAHINAFVPAARQMLLHRRALEMVIALRVWYLEHDRHYPASTTELVPAILARLPADPYSGRPFGYSRSIGQSTLPLALAGTIQPTDSPRLPSFRGQRMLYSVGPDGHDGGAVAIYELNGGILVRGKVTSSGDIIFPLPE